MNIIITGASGKIGSQLAIHYGKTNNLILQYNNNENIINNIIDSLSCYNTKIYKLKFDFQHNENFIEKTQEFFQSNILINGFSTFEENHFFNFKKENFMRDIKLNVLCPLILTKDFSMLKESKLVINFLDSKALMRDENHFTYSTSKYLFQQLTKESAWYLAPLRINGISLGLYETDNASPKNLPIKEKVNFNDIINTINYFITNNHITGEIINLDSGRHLRKG